MAHYAKVLDGIVTTVIVAEAEFFDTYVDDTPGEWIQTSYNTHENVHYGYDSNGDYVPDGGTAFRGNFAAVGGLYDVTKDAFIPPKIFESWILNEDKCIWEPPTPEPTDGKDYVWNETTKSWVEE